MNGIAASLLSVWTIEQQRWIAAVCCVLMVAGMVFSRGLLTGSMVILVINALHPALIGATWRKLVNNKFSIYCALFFLTYLISGFWSTDVEKWWEVVQIKLPFLFLPFAMLNAPLNKQKYMMVVLSGILLVLFAGMLYSLSFLLTNPGLITSGGHLPSPVDGDYIRFTMSLVLGIQMVIYLFLSSHKLVLLPVRKILLISWVLVATVYIHIQAAKSGLVCLYATVIFYFIASFIKGKGSRLYLAGFISIIIIIGMLSWQTPFIQRQVDKARSEYKIWSTQDKQNYGKAGSWIPRLNSYEIAFAVVKSNLWWGVGAGDYEIELDKKYEEVYPWFSDRKQIIPHNQLLFTILVIGLPLSLVFLTMIFLPFVRQSRYRLYSWASALVLIIGMLIEAMLEVQYGVFVYLFFTLFWMSVHKSDKHKTRSRSV